MKKSPIDWIGLIKGSVALAILLFGLYEFGKWLLSVFISLPKEFSASLVAALAAVITSAIAVFGVKYFERRKDIEQQHRVKKVEMYEDFMKQWFDLFPAPSAQYDGDKFQEFIRSFNAKAIIWGSDAFIQKYSVFRKGAVNFNSASGSNVETAGLMAIFADVLLEIRKDLGNSNKKITNRDILSLFINDIEKYM